MQFTVTAPVAGFTGRRAGVHFVGGSVTLDDDNPAEARALAHFMRREYEVTPVDLGELIDAEIEDGALQVVTVTDSTPETVDGVLKRPADSAKVADWLAYAQSLGFAPEEEEEKATKAELQKFVREFEAQAEGPATPADSDEPKDGE
jgi:hypothetical protein